MPKKNSELEISDYVQSNGDKQQQQQKAQPKSGLGQRRDVEARGERRTPQNHSNSESQSESRDERKLSNETRGQQVERKPAQNRTQNPRGPRPNFDRNQTQNREQRFNEDVNNNRRPKSFNNNNYRVNQDSQQSSDNAEKQINLGRSLNFSNTRYRRNNEQNEGKGVARHGHDDRTQPQQHEGDEKPKRYSSMRNQWSATSAKQQMGDNQKSYQPKAYGGDSGENVHQNFENQNWKANGAAQQLRQGRPIVGAQSGMNTNANVYSPTSAAAAAAALAAANLQLQYNTQAIPMVLQAQQIMSPPPGISMPQLIQQQQQQQQFYNFVPYQYQN